MIEIRAARPHVSLPAAPPQPDSARLPSDRCGALVEAISRPPLAQGPLSGLRFVAKDCMDLAGRAPGNGLDRGGTGMAPAADAPVLDRLRECGAALVGMAQMTPLAYEPSGGNPSLGRPENPVNARFICGGSSSGSAVAIASGLADFALGTDTAGSLRIPAQCCGISAWKPSAGIVPVAGVMPLAPSLDAVGVLAPRAADLAAIAAIFARNMGADLGKIAVATDLLAQASAARAAIEICRSAAIAAGFDCRETRAQPMIAACDAPVLTLLQGEAYHTNAARIAAGDLDPVLATRLAKGRTMTPADLEQARQSLAACAGEMLDTLFAADEILILPVMPIETPSVAACDPADPAFSARTLYALSAFTRFANGLGLPVVTLTAGQDSNGMPVGVQLVARAGRDRALVEAAIRIENIISSVPSRLPLPRDTP